MQGMPPQQITLPTTKLPTTSQAATGARPTSKRVALAPSHAVSPVSGTNRLPNTLGPQPSVFKYVPPPDPGRGNSLQSEAYGTLSRHAMDALAGLRGLLPATVVPELSSDSQQINGQMPGFTG